MMRLVFLGNGPFAVPILIGLTKSKHQAAAVVARPDRPRGKHRRIEPGPVVSRARELGLEIHQPHDVNAPEFREILADFAPDILVVADFGQILSPECLAVAREGGINVHASLLPKYRGAAPIVWAIYHGETETGVSIIQMTPKLDAGSVLLQEKHPIGPDTTAGELEESLAELGTSLAVQAVDLIQAGCAKGIAQNPKEMSKAPRIRKEIGLIHWDREARQIHDQVRALRPWPIAYTHWHRKIGEPIRMQILQTVPLAVELCDPRPPGMVVAVESEEIVVQTSTGQIAIRALKPAGKREMDVATFRCGYPIEVGDRFE